MKQRLFAALLAGGITTANVSAQEAPVSWTAQDANLKWGPCPPFLPKGCEIAVLHGDPASAYDGHKTAVLKPGTYAYGPAKLPHTAECKNAGPCVLFIAFESPLDAVPGNGGSAGK